MVDGVQVGGYFISQIQKLNVNRWKVFLQIDLKPNFSQGKRERSCFCIKISK